MDTTLLDEVIACLPRERTLFDYFQGHYALGLLAELAEHDAPQVGALRGGPFDPLLQKPAVKSALAGCGAGALEPDYLRGFGLERASRFLLAVERWGNQVPQRWSQTSRPGMNLVLQLNFNSSQMRALKRLTGSGNGVFNPLDHPVCRPSHPRYRETLAWARIDFDFETNEALIEEVQSDWVWFAADAAKFGLWTRAGFVEAEQVKRCLRSEFHGVARWWDEAMLWATIWFIRHELGLKHVYFHDYYTGAALKRIRCRLPPRSIYTRLPSRFCMRRTPQGPVFLDGCTRARRILRRTPDAGFYRLNLEA